MMSEIVGGVMDTWSIVARKCGFGYNTIMKLSLSRFKPKSWRKMLAITAGLMLIFYIQYFAIANWYVNSESYKPRTWGVTFTAKQATELGLDPDQTLRALSKDLGITNFRLTTFWDEIEPTEGIYDFATLDKQLAIVAESSGHVTLSIGLRQPRYPECHLPNRLKNQPIDQWRGQLDKYISTTVNRYKDNPTIVSWQLENEFHLDAFGKCPDHERQRLIEEYNLVKSLDTSKPIILSTANLWFGIPIGKPRPDQFGISVYGTFWANAIDRNVDYPFPASYYAWRAGLTKLMTGRSSMLHELQLEPWGAQPIWDQTPSIQDQSMDLKMFKKQLKKAQDIGTRDIYMWGGEWWYKRHLEGDDRFWNEIKRTIVK
jgi:hypothetical protein